MDPFRFEEFICEIVDSFGWDAKVTTRTADGGFDVVALDNRILDSKYLIECKRYRNRPVGISAVRSLHGVTVHEKATKGIIGGDCGFLETDTKALFSASVVT